jgi:hypothetical protein
MRNILPFVILSAARAELSDGQNDWRHMLLARDLRLDHMEFSETSGSWQGVAERGYLVPVAGGIDSERFVTLLHVARNYAQDAILYVDATGEAHIVMVKDSTDLDIVMQSAGVWTEYSPPYPPTQDFTEIEGRRYVTV